MPTSRMKSSGTMISNNFINDLMDCGYSQEKSSYIYEKYKRKNKLNDLQKYIDAKLGIKQAENIESYPLRDF